MKLTQLEQSGLLIETEVGFKLAVDIAMLTPLEKLDAMQPDAMLVSHIHKDHFSAEHIHHLAPKKIFMGEECIEALDDSAPDSRTIAAQDGETLDVGGGIQVTFFEVDHGPNVTVRPRQNFGFLIEADRHSIYFGGDIFNPSGIDVSTLEIDTVLLPVGGFYTFGPDEALAFAKQFKKIGKLVPMHYMPKPEARDQFNELANKAGFNTETSVVI